MNLEDLRKKIDELDKELVVLLAKRQKYVEKVAVVKNDKSLVVDKKRMEEVIARVKKLASEEGLSEQIAESLWRKIIELSIDHEFKELDSMQNKIK